MAAHELKIRVYYEDTDAGGVVYHARYLAFAERGRTEMLRAVGYEHAPLLKDGGLAFAVVAAELQYKAPARLDDELTIRSEITKVGGASMEIKQDIYCADRLLTEIKVTLVCVDSSFKAARLPPEIKKIYGSREN